MTKSYKNRGKPISINDNDAARMFKNNSNENIVRGTFKAADSVPQEKYAVDTSIMSHAVVVPGIQKRASVDSASVGSAWRGSGDTVRQGPELYSPLWLTSNTMLPRDRGTMNAWSRAFFALNPIVNNAIHLHSTYPISKLSISCPDKKIEDFFNVMIDEMELHNACVEMAQEFFVIGECFPFLHLDDVTGKWSRVTVQNPDYIYINRSVVAGPPQITLRPDSELRRIITGTDPDSIRLRRNIPPNILQLVRSGQNIPLDNFYVSHLARKISPYDSRGTSLIAPAYKALMLWDKLRECKYAQADNMINPITLVKLGGGSVDAEYKITPADLEYWRNLLESCYDEETEVLTNQGYKKFYEVIEYHEVDGLVIDAKPKPGIKIACFNPDTEELEYHEPLAANVQNHDGEMYHYENEKMNIMVTPNHKMWVSNKQYEFNGHRSLRKTIWSDWHKIEAKDLNLNDYSRFRSHATWIGNDDVKSVNVIGHEIPIELYLEYLGYVISEGCIFGDDKYHHIVEICQTTTKYYDKMKKCADAFGDFIGLKCHHNINKRSEKTDSKRQNIWNGRFYDKNLYEYFKNECGDSEGNVKSSNKHIPRWILDLSPRLLTVLLDALVAGDGSIYDNPKKQSKRFAYYTTSKQLADDVFEMIYKCGFVPTSFIRNDVKYLDNNRRQPLYTILWSTSEKGNFPLIYKTSRNSQTKEKHNLLKIEEYKGKVWCFTVPTGLFVTRRCGKTTVQSNSQYDKDFKIITHGSVDIQKISSNVVIDINPDLERLMKEIYIALMVPQVIMESGDITYANGGLSLDVLRQRYMQFQNMLSKWIRTKVFAPISQMHDFWEDIDGERRLIIPDVEWNHMSLFDLGDYIQFLSNLAVGEQKIVSEHSLFRSLGLDYENEQRMIRHEAIIDATRAKEQASLMNMSLSELRSLDVNDEIPDMPDTPLPGETPQETPVPGEEEGGGGPPMGGGGGSPMGGGKLPPPPSAPKPPPPSSSPSGGGSPPSE